ncbi:centrosomal protein of 55 kDa-like isoform X1 [Trichomycterus rosablanca]|uniref:centrosomal protein of 55 kDa-like isoform X1 n=1 Tax=Trichomycterus rosablanca TaxID=2290929 RepID=UPI002F35FB77
MASRTSKGKHSVQTEKEICKLRQENVNLRKVLDELSSQMCKPYDSENNNVLLKRILALETLREENSQLILARDQEIASLRQQLWSNSSDIVASLHAQLKQQREDAETKERHFQSLKQETETVKNKLVAVSTKCQNLQIRENQSINVNGPADSRNTALIQDQLKDALEKNQQWLIYDQQREAYVKTVLVKLHQLQQQLNQAKEALSQEEKNAHCAEKQAEETRQQYEKLVDELEEERDARQQTLTEHYQGRKELDKERLRSAELLQQIQASAKELKEVKHDNQYLQRQLHKLLRELRKANEKVARLESEKAEEETPPELTASGKPEKTYRERPQSFPSPSREYSLLDESFLECPNCKAQYSTSRHRELLVHIDECLD